MWRLIGMALVLVVFLGFVGLNLDNRCVISFGFWKTPEPVPVFFPVFAAFVLGILCSIPFAISAGVKRSRRNKTREDPAQKKKRGKDGALPEVPVAGGPYGID